MGQVWGSLSGYVCSVLVVLCVCVMEVFVWVGSSCWGGSGVLEKSRVGCCFGVVGRICGTDRVGFCPWGGV